MEKVFEVTSHGSNEIVYRIPEGNGQYRFAVSCWLEGLNEGEDYAWDQTENEYPLWQEYWDEFTSQDEWWYFYKPLYVHPSLREMVGESLDSQASDIDPAASSGYYWEWKKQCG